MKEINSFTFYRDYFNLIDTISIKDKKELLNAIVNFVFKDEEPNLSGHNQAIFNTLKKQLEKSVNKSKNAKKENQNEIKLKSNQNQNEIKKGNKTSVLSFKFYILSFKFINNNTKLINKLEDWMNYKQERKETYKEQGLKSLLKQIDTATEKYGTDAMVDLIDECMASNYKGIIFDRLKNIKPQNKPEWVDKEVKCEIASEEEKNEMEKMINEITGWK